MSKKPAFLLNQWPLNLVADSLLGMASCTPSPRRIRTSSARRRLGSRPTEAWVTSLTSKTPSPRPSPTLKRTNFHPSGTGTAFSTWAEPRQRAENRARAKAERLKVRQTETKGQGPPSHFWIRINVERFRELLMMVFRSCVDWQS